MLIFFTQGADDGDLADFEYIYNKYRNLVWFFICQRVSDECLREDIMQEVFCKVFRSLGKFQSETALKRWITVVTKNTAIDMSCRESNFKRYMSIALDEEDIIEGCMGMVQELPIDAMVQKEISEEIAALLHELKPIHYEALVLRYFMEFSPAEIAEKLNIPIDTVYSRLSRARAVLYNAISESVRKYYTGGGESDE